jgi:hypothetical protein
MVLFASSVEGDSPEQVAVQWSGLIPKIALHSVPYPHDDLMQADALELIGPALAELLAQGSHPAPNAAS